MNILQTSATITGRELTNWTGCHGNRLAIGAGSLLCCVATGLDGRLWCPGSCPCWDGLGAPAHSTRLPVCLRELAPSGSGLLGSEVLGSEVLVFWVLRFWGSGLLGSGLLRFWSSGFCGSGLGVLTGSLVQLLLCQWLIQGSLGWRTTLWSMFLQLVPQIPDRWHLQPPKAAHVELGGGEAEPPGAGPC